MTQAEIDAMSAGPEMDALVAERVMGWKVQRTSGMDNTPIWFAPTGDRRPGHTHAQVMGRPHPYSTSDAAALEVWKRISEDRLAENMNWRDTIHRTKDGWQVGYLYYDFFDVAEAPTLALAICRAALKATT